MTTVTMIKVVAKIMMGVTNNSDGDDGSSGTTCLQSV